MFVCTCACMHVCACMCVLVHVSHGSRRIVECMYVVLSLFLITLQEQLGNSVTLWKKNLTLTNEDRRQLLSGEWLTANHISAAHLLLKRAFPNKMDFVIQVTFQRNLCGLRLTKRLFKSFMFLVTIGLACQMYFVKERISLTSMIVCPVMSAL